MDIISVSDIGVKNGVNQDNYWSAILSVDGKELGLLCLCDGMGGLDNGEIASKMVISSIRESILDGIVDNLDSVLQNVNMSIYSLSKEEKMGTTCTLLLCSEGKYIIYHIGDSRCYLIRDNKPILLTKDHSAVKEYNVSESDPMYKKLRGKLTRCIGVEESIKVDIYKGEYLAEDIFLICCDGFWHYFEKLNDIVRGCNKEELIELINKYKGLGERDNITVSVLSIGGEEN